MRYAIYRCLYGEDFIQDSIQSISNYVDKIFVFWDDTPWGDIDQCIYKGEVVKFPEKFDRIIEKIQALNNPEIELIYDHQFNNINQFTHFVNDIILPNYDRPDEIMVIEVDHVFRPDQLELALHEFRTDNYIAATTRQIEIWKGFRHRVPERPYRTGVALWNMSNLKYFPETQRQADYADMPRLSAEVHNLGFAISERAMYWKHMTALGFSQAIGDSQPVEDWYESKWLNWNPETNNKNLEISLGYEHLIPQAIPYEINELPVSIYQRLMKMEAVA